MLEDMENTRKSAISQPVYMIEQQFSIASHIFHVCKCKTPNAITIYHKLFSISDSELEDMKNMEKCNMSAGEMAVSVLQLQT
jgi:hypothetical protein